MRGQTFLSDPPSLLPPPSPSSPPPPKPKNAVQRCGTVSPRLTELAPLAGGTGGATLFFLKKKNSAIGIFLQDWLLCSVGLILV